MILTKQITINYSLPRTDIPYTKIIFAVDKEQAEAIFKADPMYKEAHIISTIESKEAQ